MGKGEVRSKPKQAYNYINNRLKWPFRTDELTEEQIHITKAYYYANNTLIDDWVGRIVKTLKEQSLYDNTVIIFTSDHGDLLGDHGLIYKQCFYEQSVKAPLIIHAPAYFKPGRTGAMVESIDLFSTLCDLGRAWPGEGRQGKSLVPLLQEVAKRGSHREAAFSENYFGRMIRYENHKMVYYPGRPYGELYDLAKDPDEQKNLWDELEGSSIKTRLKDLLLDWSFTSEDTLPLPVRHDHQDESPLHLLMVDGHTAVNPRQQWQFDHMAQLYQGWEFSTDGMLR
jgi:arylsulfatase A-like enzyme